MRILVLSPSLPYPAIWGFNIRVQQILRHLSRRNSVSLLCYGASPEEESAAREALAGMCEEVVTVRDNARPRFQTRGMQAAAALGPRSFHMHRFFSRRLQARLTELTERGRYDLVQVESSPMASFDCGRVPLVLDEHNLEYELLRRANHVETSAPRRAFATVECRKVEREEKQLWRAVRGCVLTSTREQAIVRGTVPGLPTAVVPNGVDLDYFRPSSQPATPDRIVFTGLMTYRPNADAASHFLREVWPAVRAARPAATFTAVGWGLPDALRPLLGNGVVHTGRVPDVRPYLREASVVVAPLRIGSGTRLKILEALAMGKAVVSTSVGCEGLDVRHGQHLLVADDPSSFARSVVRLLQNPAEAEVLGRRGRELVEDKYGWAQAIAELERFHGALSESERPAAVAAGQ
jgi:sugar transferase (PEP-CTERM/EpsH1 system associated)